MAFICGLLYAGCTVKVGGKDLEMLVLSKIFWQE